MSLEKTVMKFYEVFPDPDDYANWEVFKQDRFLKADEKLRNEMLNNSVHHNYTYEKDICTLTKYFPSNLFTDFENKSVLDLGSFTGGRLIRWVEKFKFANGVGIDINPIFKEAGDNYLREHRKDLSGIKFVTGVGESLPFEDKQFDYIISFDVFEHVQNIEHVLKECHRVLKKGGMLFTVFPQYYQPFESHLGFVTKVPAIHWIFNSEKLAKAYYEIIKERGENASWYAILSPILDEWEKLPSLNGTTVRKYNRIIQNNEFKEIFRGKPPIFGDGRMAEKYFVFKLLKYICWLPAQIPILNELFLGKIVSVLIKD